MQYRAGLATRRRWPLFLVSSRIERNEDRVGSSFPLFERACLTQPKHVEHYCRTSFENPTPWMIVAFPVNVSPSK
jgi:hypothetical protein